MVPRIGVGAILLAALIGSPARLDAGIARFHYIVATPQGQMEPAPSPGTGGAVGEKRTARGTCLFQEAPKPTHFATFRHPATNQCITVPLRLPEGTPTIMHRPGHYIYNYGSYTVDVQFLPDGSVDVVYNSGLLRDIEF